MYGSLLVFFTNNHGTLSQISCIREDSNGTTTCETKVISKHNFGSNWKGTSTNLETPFDELQSETLPSQFKWGMEGNTFFFPPDVISVDCPLKPIPKNVEGSGLVPRPQPHHR